MNLIEMREKIAKAKTKLIKKAEDEAKAKTTLARKAARKSTGNLSEAGLDATISATSSDSVQNVPFRTVNQHIALMYAFFNEQSLLLQEIDWLIYPEKRRFRSDLSQFPSDSLVVDAINERLSRIYSCLHYLAPNIIKIDSAFDTALGQLFNMVGSKNKTQDEFKKAYAVLIQDYSTTINDECRNRLKDAFEATKSNPVATARIDTSSITNRMVSIRATRFLSYDDFRSKNQIFTQEELIMNNPIFDIPNPKSSLWGRVKNALRKGNLAKDD